MEIKFQQSEIEQAIQAHLRSMIKLAEGAGITVSLSATRGQEGFTAIIDITPPGEVQPPKDVPLYRSSETVAEPIPAQTTEAKAPPKKRLVVDKQPEVQAEVVAEVEEVIVTEDKPPFKEEPVATQAGFKGFAKEPEEEVVAEATAEVEPEAKQVPAEDKPPTRKSLFGGLGKPSNS